ncbi:demethoxyubiquinone hydroxylase family protein, partial [Xanthomonas perforans]
MAVGSTAERGQNRRMTQIPPTRLHSPVARLPVVAPRPLDPVFGNPPADRPNPAADTPDLVPDPVHRRPSAGLVRINH